MNGGELEDRDSAQRAESRERPALQWGRRFPPRCPAGNLRRVTDSADQTQSGAPNRDPRGVPEQIEHFGHYRLLDVLGRGAQGVVYLAENTTLGRKVALKMLEGTNAFSGKTRERFQREAAVTSKLDHPGICSIYEFGELNGIPFMAMQYVRGTTLADLILMAKGAPRTTSKMDPGASTISLVSDNALEDVLRLIERTARALHVAHEAGLVHRDIKPGNIMVTPDGNPVLLDFGLAREVDTTGHTLTETGQVLGTPAYMAPEQLLGVRDEIDRRTDVYALGVTLFECLTLERPFHADTFEVLFDQILKGAPIAPRKVNPRIPRDLSTVIEVAMERDRERRYATALEFAEELRRVRSFEPIRAKAAGPITRLRKWARRKPAVAVAVAAVVLMALLGVGVLIGGVLHRRQAARDHLDRAEASLAAGDVEAAAIALAQARELTGDSVAALDLEVRIEDRRDRDAVEARRAADATAAEAARAESAEQQTLYASLRAQIRARDAELAKARTAVFAGFASATERATVARQERDLARLRLDAERAVQNAREALERAARHEAAWGTSTATDAAFAAFFMERWRDARVDGDTMRAEMARSAVARHDVEGRYTDELRGVGSLVLTVSPADAEVFLFRYEPYELGRTDAVVPRSVPIPTTGVGRVRPAAWVDDYFPGDLCLVITAVEPQSAAADAGLSPGDLVVRFAGQRTGDGVRLSPETPSSEWGDGSVPPFARIATLNGAPIGSRLDWRTAPPAVGGTSDRITFDGIDGEFESARTEIDVVTAQECLEAAASSAACEWIALKSGERVVLNVDAGARAGLKCAPTAYPLICARENLVAGGVGGSANATLEIEPGSYLAFARGKGRDDLRVPITIAPGATLATMIDLLPQGSAPTGFVFVPAGPFAVAGDAQAQEPAPAGIADVDAFFIARRELTNAEWNEFLADPDTQRRMDEAEQSIYLPREPGGLIPKENLGGPSTPVMGISWNDARDYVAWRNAQAEAAGEPWVYDLPSELEWEKAARGVDGRAFPWGDRFDFELTIGLHTKSVNLFDAPGGYEPRDESPYGVQDLGGLRTEWTRDAYVLDPRAPPLYRRRGGAWSNSREIDFRAASRHFAEAASSTGISGVRLVARPRE